MKTSRPSAGFSLLELLIVITIMSIMAGLIAVNSTTNTRDQLQGTAEIVAGEIAYARSLAVTNNDNYLLTFDATNGQFVLTHSGTNGAFNTLPMTAFRSPQDTATQHVVNLDALPNLGTAVHLLGALAMTSSPASVTTLEFGPLGETTGTDPTVVWLAAGSGDNARYLSITVNPVTGLTSIGSLQATRPVGL